MKKSLSRRSVLKTAVSLGTVACAAPLRGRSRPPASRPNIIVLLADDLRYDAVGYLNKKVRTPNLDRLAGEGLRFNNAFVTTSTCAISRASIFTGMYARRHGIWDFATPLSDDLLRSSYPAQLRNAGYRTGFFGKYGVGDLKTGETGKRVDGVLSEGDRANFDVIENYGFSYFPNEDEKQHIHTVLADRAEQFIRSSAGSQPFCLSLSFISPHDYTPNFEWDKHFPAEVTMPAEPQMLALYEKEIGCESPLMDEASFQLLPDFLQRSFAHNSWLKDLSDPRNRREYLRRYFALVTGMDHVIGRVLRALEKAKAASNTVILFTSDNGHFLGDYQLKGKWFGYEPSIRVPLIIRPAGKPISADITAPALNIDLAPTMLALAGVAAPSRMQGRSLTALWTGEPSEPWRKDFLYEYFVGCAPPSTVPCSEGVRDERYTYLRYPFQQGANETLFDRAANPAKNIIDSAPVALVERLRRRTDELIKMNT